MMSPVMVAFQELGWSYMAPLVFMWGMAVYVCHKAMGIYTLNDTIKMIVLIGVALVPIANMLALGGILLYLIVGIIGSHGSDRMRG